MLPLTDASAAREDFINLRLNGQDTTGSSQYYLLPTSSMQHSPESAAEKKAHEEEIVLSRWPYILLGCLVFVALLLGLCLWRCCCRRGARWGPGKRRGLKAAAAARSSKVGGGIIGGGGATQYQPLHDPNSQVNLQPMGGYGGGQGYGYSNDQGGYKQQGYGGYRG